MYEAISRPTTKGRRFLEHLADFFAARHFADAGVACFVGQDREVARKVRAVRAAQVEQHAVFAGNWNNAHGNDARRPAAIPAKRCGSGESFVSSFFRVCPSDSLFPQMILPMAMTPTLHAESTLQKRTGSHTKSMTR